MACVHCAESGLFDHVKLQTSFSAYIAVRNGIQNSKPEKKEVAEKDNIILPKKIIIIAKKKDSPVISYFDIQVPFFPKQAKILIKIYFHFSHVK